MKLDALRNPTMRSSLLFATIAAIFVTDLLTPLGTVVWALYTIPLLLSVKLPRWWAPLACAALCSTLVVLGFYVSPSSSVSMETVVFNRLAGIAILWAMALILSQSRRLGIWLTMRTEEVRLQGSLLNEARDAILVRDLGDRILYWNRGAGEQYGWFEKEAIGRLSHELLQTRFPEPLHTIMEQVVRDGSWEGHVEHRTRDGRRVDVASRWTAQKDDAGHIQSILEINTDITELKQAQELWREAAVYTTTIFNSSPLPILVMDPKGHILQWNPSAERVFEWTAQEALGKPCPTVPEAGLDDLHWMINQAIQNGRLDQLVRQWRKKDGSVIQARISISALRDREASPLGVVAILEDITERRRADETLKESEERFSKAFNEAPIGKALVATDGHWLQVNRALCGIVGYSEDELLATNFQSITHEDDLEADLAQVRQLLKGEIPAYQMEKRYIHKLGHVVWILLTVSLVRGTDGSPLYFIAQIQDITDRKQTEQALRESVATLRGFFDSASLMMGVVELEGDDIRHISDNVATAKFFKTSPEEMRHRLASEMGAPRPHIQRWIEHYRQSERTGHPVRFEYEHGGSDNPRTLSATVCFVTRNEHGVARFAYIVEDISERQQAEKALRGSEERFRTAFEETAVGMALLSTDGTFLHANSILCRMLGYTEEELRSTRFQDVTHPDDLDSNLQRLNQLLQGEVESFHLEKRYRHKLGRDVWGFASVSVVRDADGKPVNTIAQIQDITERKRTETVMRRMAEGVSSVTGQEFFRSLVTLLAQSVEADYAFIGELTGGRMDRVRTVAVFAKGRIADNFEYDLAHTPCEHVIQQTRCTYPRDVRQAFPEDRLLVEMDVEAYVGTPLFASAGRVMGLLVVMHGKPLSHPDQADSLLRIFAARAAAEMERAHAEGALRASEQALRVSEQHLRALLEEREQLMRDLHDGLIQSLYTIGLSVEECQRLTEEDIKKAQARLAQTVADVNKVIRDVRQHLAKGDDAMPFSANRLKNELRRVASAMERADSMHIDLKVDARAAACLTTKERKEMLYIAQEAMSNCLRHSSASTVRVALQMERDRVRLEVEDNGTGFDRQVTAVGNGLLNIEERAAGMRAKLELVSRLKHGTRLRLDLPIHEESSMESPK